jgi:hypothetical protein
MKISLDVVPDSTGKTPKKYYQYSKMTVERIVPPARLELTTFGWLKCETCVVYETNALPTELQKQRLPVSI